jgi:hypothetical protein
MDISSKALGKARRSAIKAKTFVPCVPCLAYGRKCNESRPCSRCSRDPGSCTPVYGTKSIRTKPVPENSVERVDRPVTKTSKLLELAPLDNFVPVKKYTSALGWGIEQLMKFSARGHPVESLAKFLTSQFFGQNLTAIADAVQSSKNIAENVKMSQSVVKANAAIASMQLWDMDTNVGFVSISFDAISGRRRQVLANPCMAKMLGMHNEEYLARTANRDLAFPYTALDSLCLFLFISVRDSFPSSTPRELYARMQSRVGSTRRGMLVISRGLTVFNDLTQSSEVLCPFL